MDWSGFSKFIGYYRNRKGMIKTVNNISKYITYSEAIHSDTAKREGIANKPDKVQLQAMKLVAGMIFEPVRIHFGVPIYISSFFRSAELNKILKGSKTSDHVKGKAIDMDADRYGGVTNKEIFEYIKDNLEFDQLIWEYGTKDNPAWVHCGYRTKDTNRNMIINFKG